jgi:sortase A
MLENFEPQDFTKMFEQADAYNEKLNSLDFPLQEYAKIEELYWKTLDVTGTGMMGYITVPKISQELPVYHGTDDAVLGIAVGHFQGSSLPVGGVNTHSVVSAHRGLPTATLFTYLDRMEVGDTFTFSILDKTFVYEVDQIRIVEPDDTSLIGVEKGKDYCTLLTCTPYGINTQRLLVRGHQVDTSQNRNLYISNEAYRVDVLIVMPIVALPIILFLLIYIMFTPVKKETLGEEDLS